MPEAYKRLAVTFRWLHVVEDKDMFGPGELFFGGEVNGQTTGVKGPFIKDSGDNIILAYKA